MLYYINLLSDGGDFFNLFRYITFRAGGAFFTALLFGFIFGKPLINLLKRKQKGGQPIRKDGPQSHLTSKAGTPTMGGVLILGSVFTASLLWARLDNTYIWLILFVTLGFGVVGFIDDYRKVLMQNSDGLGRKYRLLIGASLALVAAFWAQNSHPVELSGYVAIPVFKDSNETSSQREEYLIALERVLQTRDEIDSFMEEYNIEALVGLSWSPAWAINHDGGDDEAIAEYKFWVNGSYAAMAGYPHVTIPFEYVDNLPIGMSFIGSKWDDKKLIEFAYAAEQLIQFKPSPNL